MADHADASRLLRTFDPALPLIDYVEEIARRRPDAPAILLRDRSLSYGEMMVRVHAVAAALRTAGVKRADLVGLAFSRSASLGVPQTTRLGFCLRISRSSSTEARERRRLLRLCSISGWSRAVKRLMKASACLSVGFFLRYRPIGLLEREASRR